MQSTGDGTTRWHGRVMRVEVVENAVFAPRARRRSFRGIDQVLLWFKIELSFANDMFGVHTYPNLNTLIPQAIVRWVRSSL